MTMNFKKTACFTILTLALVSCSNDSTSDLIDSTPIDEDVTYTANIKSIIDNNCISCHGTIPTVGVPMSLTTYENVREAVLNRGLIDRISLENGTSGLMPEGGPRLPQNTIDLIIQWQTDGFQE